VRAQQPPARLAHAEPSARARLPRRAGNRHALICIISCPPACARSAADPDDIFSNVETCDLVDIFAPPGKPTKDRYNRRGSSGNWKADQLTWREVHEYNQAMGYYKGQQG
jgi:hypothetical protein